ncbi:hypothetical protein AB0G60_11940 [Streptomyces angustmyceticus]|uniref:Uncharacterized protein n=1 Tax=Streptomyces angustmyceticus TaxID=285578 RepID=A0A5J4LJE7_9ACTN|nr:hypothetical protein [Streptomyces angustmyceticus]GES31676.1 hypothetical protein San01_41630 [Streptomyces angustmyceticus]
MSATGVTARPAPGKGQILTVLGLLTAVAVLYGQHDGLPFWLGALTGVVSVLGYLVCFDSPRGIWQWLPAGVGFCAAFLFAGQFLVALLA